MKVIVEISEDQREFFLDFLKSNDFPFEVDDDFEVPQWQKDMVNKRRKQAYENPEILSTWGETLKRLKERG